MKIDHNTSVKELKKSGYNVDCLHWRYKKNDSSNELFLTIEFEDKRDMDEKGGYSKMFLVTPEGKRYEAETECSRVDNFSTNKSHKILLGRVGKLIENDHRAAK